MTFGPKVVFPFPGAIGTPHGKDGDVDLSKYIKRFSIHLCLGGAVKGTLFGYREDKSVTAGWTDFDTANHAAKMCLRGELALGTTNYDIVLTDPDRASEIPDGILPPSHEDISKLLAPISAWKAIQLAELQYCTAAQLKTWVGSTQEVAVAGTGGAQSACSAMRQALNQRSLQGLPSEAFSQNAGLFAVATYGAESCRLVETSFPNITKLEEGAESEGSPRRKDPLQLECLTIRALQATGIKMEMTTSPLCLLLYSLNGSKISGASITSLSLKKPSEFMALGRMDADPVDESGARGKEVIQVFKDLMVGESQSMLHWRQMPETEEFIRAFRLAQLQTLVLCDLHASGEVGKAIFPSHQGAALFNGIIARHSGALARIIDDCIHLESLYQVAVRRYVTGLMSGHGTPAGRARALATRLCEYDFLYTVEPQDKLGRRPVRARLYGPTGQSIVQAMNSADDKTPLQWGYDGLDPILVSGVGRGKRDRDYEATSAAYGGSPKVQATRLRQLKYLVTVEDFGMHEIALSDKAAAVNSETFNALDIAKRDRVRKTLSVISTNGTE